MTMSALTTTSATTTRSWAEAARARTDGAVTATMIAAPAAATLSAPDRSRMQHERLPVGLRPVTQQQLEARHGQRVVSAASLTLAGNTRKTSNEAPRASGTRTAANGHRASADESGGDGEDGGWKSVESRSSKWNRSHKQRGASTAEPSKRAASLAPASAASSTALTPYAYSWATTSVTSAAATNATNGTSSVRTPSGQRDDTASRRTQSYRSDPPLPPSSVLGGAAAPPPPRRSGSTPRGRGGGGGGHDSSQTRPSRSGMRSPPLMLPAPPGASDSALYRRTSLQQLLTKIETEQQQQEIESPQSQLLHLSRRRTDPTTSSSSSSTTSSSTSSTAATAAAGTNDQQHVHDRRSASDQANGTKQVQQSQQPLVQKCGDKRDFFFRNLEFETRNRLQIDDVAGFSVTEHEMATKISEAILALFYNCDIADPICAAAESTPLVRTRSSLTITDATACIGGNVISFCDYFAIVNAVECDRTRCAMLEHNLEVLQKRNAICIHASYLLVMHDLQQDVVFIDPPWGGPEYKDLERVDLFLDDVPLYDICTQLYGHAAIVVLKVPTNFDADKFAAHVPGTVTVRTDLNKMHLVAIDFREPLRQREAQLAPATSV